MYTYTFTKQVEKFLEKQNADFIHNFTQKVEILSQDPFGSHLDIKPLRGMWDNYRLRIWKYRFLYYVNHTEICIYFYKAWSRGDIYK